MARKVRKAKVIEPWVRAKALRRLYTARVDAPLLGDDLPCALCGKLRADHTGPALQCPLLPAMKLTKPWRTKRCPVCGLKLFFNDEECRVGHQAPMCDGFRTVLARCSEGGEYMLVIP